MENIIKKITVTSLMSLILIIGHTYSQNKLNKAFKKDVDVNIIEMKKQKMKMNNITMNDSNKTLMTASKKDHLLADKKSMVDSSKKMRENTKNHIRMNDYSKMKSSTKTKMKNKTSIIRKGVIDLKAIDKNKDGKVFQDVMDWNVISDTPGKCSLCGMKLKEVTLVKAKENLLKNGFKVK